MRLFARSVALALGALVLAVPQAVLLATGLGGRGSSRAWTVLPRLFHRFCCAVLGIGVRIEGQPSRAKQTLWVTNHISYLDVAVLGSFLRCAFVAKDEVRGWPVFGLLARLQRTVFIGRRRAGANEALDTLGQALAEGSSLVLFAEGTTSDGRAVRAFKSPVFALLRASAPPGLVVQPVTLRVERDGEFAGNRSAPPRHYPYIDDDVLVPHLAHFMRGGSTKVTVVFHPPIDASELPADRKQTARELHATVAAGLDSGPAPVGAAA